MTPPVSLADKYELPAGRVYMNGTQALVRLLLAQKARDEAAGLNTEGFVSGYRGSPLGMYDHALWRAKAHLQQHDIAVAAAHTNLDIARGGVNDVLAEAIGLSKLSSFVITQQEESGQTESLGRIGTLPQPMAIRDFAEQVRKALPTEHVRFVDAGSRPVRKVALCSGAGAEFIAKAAAMGDRKSTRLNSSHT